VATGRVKIPGWPAMSYAMAWPLKQARLRGLTGELAVALIYIRASPLESVQDAAKALTPVEQGIFTF